MLKYLGYGTTDANGVATLEYDASGQSTSGYTGVGAGEVDFVAKLHDDGTVVSQPVAVYDCIVKEDEDLTSNKTWNATLNDCDYYLEFKVNPSSRTSCYSYVQIGEDSTLRIQIGHLFSNGQSGIRVMNGTSPVAEQLVSATYMPLDTDTLITCRKTGTQYVVTIGEQTLPTVTETTVTDTYLLNLNIANNHFKDFKIYPI